MANFKILFDCGKPYDIEVTSEEELKKEIKKFYLTQDKEEYHDIIVLNYNDEDITETQFIEELIKEITDENYIYNSQYESLINGNISEFKKWLRDSDEGYNFIKWLQQENLKI